MRVVLLRYDFIVEAINFYLLYLPLLGKRLFLNSAISKVVPFDYNLGWVIDSFILLTDFNGNNFPPNLVSAVVPL